MLDWEDFSTDSAVEDTALLISERSQSLILTALASIQRRYHWLEVDDATWDDIDGAIAEAHQEVMSVNMPDFSPIGMVAWFPLDAANIPSKWLICDGSAVSQATYPDLYPLLRDNFGHGGGNFNLPDLRQRFLFGAAIDANIGATGGADTHTLAVAEMPSHNHVQRGRNAVASSNFASAVAVQADLTQITTVSTTLNAGGGEPHNNMPPYTRGYWCIKALP